MKELSIEEKAKRYNEAIKVAENIHKFSSDPAEIKRMEEIFPELKESEDERIRKEIIKYFKKYPALSLGDYNVQDILAWLEKQAEHAIFFNKIQIGDKVTRNRDGVLVNLSQLKRVSQDEQKPVCSEEPLSDIENRIINFAMQFHDNRMKPEAEWKDEVKMLRDNISSFSKIDTWSEEDEAMWAEISDLLWEGYKQSGSKFSWDDIRNWVNPKLKSLKERVQPQPKQEWSEEDESRMDNMCHFLEEYGDQYYGGLTLKGTISWLKSLRHQSQWKPSDQELDAILTVIGDEEQEGSDVAKELLKLYHHLKKLRNE